MARRDEFRELESEIAEAHEVALEVAREQGISLEGTPLASILAPGPMPTSDSVHEEAVRQALKERKVERARLQKEAEHKDVGLVIAASPGVPMTIQEPIVNQASIQNLNIQLAWRSYQEFVNSGEKPSEVCSFVRFDVKLWVSVGT